MAQLKDTIIQGDLKVTGNIYGEASSAKAVPLSGVTDADDLKAIEALSGTSGFLKKTAANTWSLDTNSYASSTHTHGSITNNGQLGTASKIVVTDASKNITTGSITPSDIVLTNDSRLSDARTPLSHSHGNVTNAGQLATASRIVVTDSSKNITTGSIDPANLVVTTDSRLSDARTPLSHTHGSITNDGKLGTASRIVVTDANSAIGVGSIDPADLVVTTDSRLSDARTPLSHTHGNIANGGTISSAAVSVANGDYLLIADSSNSNKIERAVTFDGSTEDQALTKKGTWKKVLPATTYEWNAELACGGSDWVKIGKFWIYDSNITVTISSTTSNAYHATLVIATQNNAIQKASVFGDYANAITPKLWYSASHKTGTTSPSNATAWFEIYYKADGYSKNLMHIQCEALGTGGTPTDILVKFNKNNTSSSEIYFPDDATLQPVNLFTSNRGVTSVQVQATSPVSSSTSTAQTSTLNTTISLADAYGDTKNPYGTKNANVVLAGPSSGNAAAPSFRALVSADIPDLSGTYSVTSHTHTAFANKVTFPATGNDALSDGTYNYQLPAANGTLALTSDANKVTQTVSSDSWMEHPVLLKYSANSTEETDTVKAAGNVTINPGSGTLTASYLKGYVVVGKSANTTLGTGATAEGTSNTASGDYSHAEGSGNKATGPRAHAEGYQSTAAGDYSHAEGQSSHANGNNSHAEGNTAYAVGDASHAEGYYTRALGQYSHAEGYGKQSSGTVTGSANATSYTAGGSVAIGDVLMLGSDNSKACAVTAIQGSTITVDKTLSDQALSNAQVWILRGISYGQYTHAEGQSNATGNYAHAEGMSIATAQYSHAEGHSSAYGTYAHSEGTGTASKSYAHAEGSGTSALGGCSHAEGTSSSAGGQAAHAEGTGTIANSYSQHVFGTYNIGDTGSELVKGSYVEIVGNGTSSTRANARTLDWSGNEVLAGKLTVGAAPTANMDVATKQYVDGIAVSASSTTPAMDGTASAGSETAYSRGDHVHPTDTSRQAKITASGILKGDGAGTVTAATAGTDYAEASHTHGYSDVTDFATGVNATNTGRLTKYVQQNAVASCNNARTTGFFYVQSNDANRPTGVGGGTSSTDYHLIAIFYSDVWGSQIAQDFRSTKQWHRNCNNGTWSAWVEEPAISDSDLVHIAGEETITGLKKFTNAMEVSRTTSGPILKLSSAAGDTNFILERTSGSQCVLEAGATVGLFGTKTNHKLQVRTNYTNRMEFDTSGGVTLATAPAANSNSNQLATTKWVNDKGYLTSYTETDPVFTASDAYGISSTDISNWNGKQSSITATGILKGAGSGSVSSAVAGTDYVDPSSLGDLATIDKPSSSQTTTYLRGDGTWQTVTASFDGGQVTNDITLYTSGTGNSPALIFQRGTLGDSYNDWRIQDRTGTLHFDQWGNGMSAWQTDRVTIDTYGKITAAGGLVGALTGNVTGNLTGNVTGDVTGNADTADLADLAESSRCVLFGSVVDKPEWAPSTDSAATAFLATVDDLNELKDGVMMFLKNGKVTSAAASSAPKGFTINVNNLGAKYVYASQGHALATTQFNINNTNLFIYNTALNSGAGGWELVYGYNANTTYTNASLGCGYFECTTAEATTAKTAALKSGSGTYAIVYGGLVTVEFTNAVPAGSTLNLASKGAKAIWYKGAAITAGVIKAGDIATFITVYGNSAYTYRLIAIDRFPAPFTVTVTMTGTLVAPGTITADKTFAQITSAIQAGSVVSANINDELWQLHKYTSASIFFKRISISSSDNEMCYASVSSSDVWAISYYSNKSGNSIANRTTAVNAADTNYTTYMARGVALLASNSNDTPTVNGTIAWYYE